MLTLTEEQQREVGRDYRRRDERYGWILWEKTEEDQGITGLQVKERKERKIRGRR